MINEAIILCGGQGTRLRPLTNDNPKALIEVGGKPMLQWQLEWLKKNGVKKIVLACGYMSDKISEYMENSGVEFKIAEENEPLGTGGAIRNALQFVDGERFIVANVDDINDLNVSKAAAVGENVICLAHPKLPFGAVMFDWNNIVKDFVEKPTLRDIWVNMGVSVLAKKDLLPLLAEKCSLEMDAFPKLVEARKLKSYMHNGFWHTINAVKDIDDFKKPW
ncbi:MAG: nucleotidyltransferase family protein [Candidatus Aenigmatarchaeota archaeon]